MIERRRVSAVFNHFDSVIEGLIRLDAQNQQRYRAGPGRPGVAVLSKNQMSLITEGVFIRAFSSYESFLEQVFILYCRGKHTMSGLKVNRFIVPKDAQHAREIIKSAMPFIEWNSPDTMIRRSETYLDGGPIKQAIVQHRDRLNTIRKIRNAIAHRSDEAWQKYASTVASELRVQPMRTPEPGEFLMMTDPRSRAQHFLLTYLQVLKSVASIATN